MKAFIVMKITLPICPSFKTESGIATLTWNIELLKPSSRYYE